MMIQRSACLEREQQRLADSPFTGTVRMVVWDVEGSHARWQRLLCLSGTLTADVVCVQGLSGLAADGRPRLLAQAMGMSPHVACDPAGDEVVIFTGCRVEVREFLVLPTAIAVVRIDGWELTVVATHMCDVDAVARLRHIRTLSSLTGDVVLCGCFLGVSPLLTGAGFRDAATISGATTDDSVWLTPGLADRLVDYTATDRDARRNTSDHGPAVVTLCPPG
jgi:hypothetical protein